MYRHTTPVPLKHLAGNGPEGEAEIPLIRSERAVESVWGDYPGDRAGAGQYTDLSYDGIPVGRLWATDEAVGLLHVPVEGNWATRRESSIQYWNVSAEIRRSKHEGIPAADAFDNIVSDWSHTPVVVGSLDNINYPDIDAIFYQGRYDPEDTEIWCEEMK